eukprot:gnl/MRDRNA2_/MRDRNA2_95705_c0_seq1.p1 gnl/MRDRNA2_/MRDRNA2_95705_c0~~gnl/MRDRNA2_/MRDRNA2_95705_c0_seq1.p1  ORF type:complete len:235 (+),score=20.79 gnl/MRDRNA2_/MRDRNA2_95705_c0_seq1:103-807(+)
MGVRPLNQFFCGCSVTFGVKLILFCNLLQNFFYIVTASSNIIFRHPTVGFNVALATQTFNAAFALFGMPFIFGGILGVWYGMETHLKMYLYYTIVSFSVDMMLLVSHLILNDVCNMLPAALKASGEAFACGFARVGAIIFIVAVVIIESYCIFTIWSLCEDFKAGGCGGKLPALLGDAEAIRKKRITAKDYHDGLYPIQSAPKSYGSTANAMFGGSTKIFHGHFHETAFPPKVV